MSEGIPDGKTSKGETTPPLRGSRQGEDGVRSRAGGGSIPSEEGLLEKPLSREQPPSPPLSGGLFFHSLVGGHRLYPPDKGGQGGCFYQSKGVSPLLSKKGSFSTTPRSEELQALVFSFAAAPPSSVGADPPPLQPSHKPLGFCDSPSRGE